MYRLRSRGTQEDGDLAAVVHRRIEGGELAVASLGTANGKSLYRGFDSHAHRAVREPLCSHGPPRVRSQASSVCTLPTSVGSATSSDVRPRRSARAAK